VTAAAATPGEHIDWRESQLDPIRQLGSAEYLSAQIRD
jgi:bacterioferritin (cytochrome b1)